MDNRKYYKLDFGHTESSLFEDQCKFIDVHMHNNCKQVTFIDQKAGSFTFELIDRVVGSSVENDQLMETINKPSDIKGKE